MSQHPSSEASTEPAKSPAEAAQVEVGPQADYAAGPLHRLAQRRHFLVHARDQLRAGFLVAMVVLLLLVLLNVSLYAIREGKSSEILSDVPELESIIRSQNRVEFTLVLLASVVFLTGVFVVTILETHKTAGAAYNLSQRINDIRQGRYNARLRLRKGDHLRELEVAFNDMSRALQERTWRDVDALERMAVEAEKVESPVEASQLASRLRELAEHRRTLAG